MTTQKEDSLKLEFTMIKASCSSQSDNVDEDLDERDQYTRRPYLCDGVFETEKQFVPSQNSAILLIFEVSETGHCYYSDAVISLKTLLNNIESMCYFLCFLCCIVLANL